MSSLFGTMSIAMSSLLAQQSAISVTANNVSNVNTPGYSRQRADLNEGDAIFTGTRMVGTGVTMDKITSLRDRVLELRIDTEKQQQGSLEAQVSSLSDIEVLFSSDTQNLGDSLNQFFNSLSELSSNASSIPLRQSVLMNASNLVNGFHNATTTLQQRQSSLDLDIQQSVTKVNEITKQIADVNKQISAQGDIGEEQIGTLVDKRTCLLGNLSELIGNQVTTGDDGLTVTTANGIPLVVGSGSYALDFSKNFDGSPYIASGGVDITATITGGRLEGFLTVRGTVIPGMLADLDSLASTLVDTFNTAHKRGFDLSGTAGTDFFAAPANGVGAASGIAVSVTDPSQIAASSDGTAGSNGNVNRLIGVRDERNSQGQTPLEHYANIAFEIGSKIANAIFA